MSMETLTAALADRYTIERELGQGGMATVYVAHDTRHDRQVAIKVLKPEVSAEFAADRFLQEIRTTANLQHPHIIPVFDSGVADGLLYFVMPLIEGESLRDRLDREGPLPIDEALRLVRELAGALQYAHECGILHRDLKPENVLLSRGHAMLADFGIARSDAGPSEARLTRTGTSIGTPAYMSPEQATGELELSAASDVYGLASILYELLTGEPPFTGATMQAILVKRFTQEPPRPRDARAETPPACDAAVVKGMARDPGQRFPTARAFADALHGSGEGADVVPRRAASDRSLVVLPFLNQSPDPDNAFVADGLTEEIITDLASVTDLAVLSRTSSMQLKGTTKSIRTLGQELGVRYALAGSVRKAGTALRITVELVDAVTDTPRWAEKFSGTMDDVFDVQERVAREVVRVMGITLSADDDRRLSDRPIASARAFELYLQARQAVQRYQLDRGEALLEQAIAIEGEVPALRALRAYRWFALVRMGENREEPLALVEAEARALIELAPDAPYGYALRGYACYERGDLVEAVQSFRAAEARDPNDAGVLFELGRSLRAACQHEEAAATAARLTARDPLSPFAELLQGANTWFVGRAADGPAHTERALTIEPASVIAHWALGYNYAMIGELPKARHEAQWMVDHAPQLPYTTQLRTLVAAIDGRRDEALGWLRQVDSAALDAHHTFHLSESFIMAGDQVRGLELFEHAVDHGFYPYDFFAVHCPFLAPVRGTPEFARILEKAARRVAEFSA